MTAEPDPRPPTSSGPGTTRSSRTCCTTTGRRRRTTTSGRSPSTSAASTTPVTGSCTVGRRHDQPALRRGARDRLRHRLLPAQPQAGRGPRQGHVTDISPGHGARPRCATPRELGLDVDGRVADAETLPYDDASFRPRRRPRGAAPHPGRRARDAEVLRVLKPGGRFVFAGRADRGRRLVARRLGGLTWKSDHRGHPPAALRRQVVAPTPRSSRRRPGGGARIGCRPAHLRPRALAATALRAGAVDVRTVTEELTAAFLGWPVRTLEARCIPAPWVGDGRSSPIAWQRLSAVDRGAGPRAAAAVLLQRACHRHPAGCEPAGRDPRAGAAAARSCRRRACAGCVRHRAWTPYYLVRYWRFLRLRLRHPRCRHRRLRLPRPGRRAHRGGATAASCSGAGCTSATGSAARARRHAAHRRQDRARPGEHRELLPGHRDRAALHRRRLGVHLRLRPPLRRYARADQGPGHRQVPGAHRGGLWVGVKASVLRGARVGDGSVLAAHTVVRGVVPAGSVVAGRAGRVVRDRAAVYAASGGAPGGARRHGAQARTRAVAAARPGRVAATARRLRGCPGEP